MEAMMLAALELSRATGRLDTLKTQTRLAKLANIGDVLGTWARLFPDKVGARDLEREMTFRLWHQRACRLANALIGIGLTKGDPICILAYNCVEWLEVYAASALAGLGSVPSNFSLP